MAETDINEYNLSSSERKQSLKISIINNQKIYSILTNKETGQKYISSITLNELRQLCKVFLLIQTIQEAFLIIKNSIEAGKITLSEDPKGEDIIIEYNTSLQNQDYPPFDIKLLLNKSNEELPSIGSSTQNTTENQETIVKPKVKGPTMRFEYIEPKLQAHQNMNVNQNINNYYPRSNSAVQRRKLSNSQNNLNQVRKINIAQVNQTNNFGKYTNQENYYNINPGKTDFMINQNMYNNNIYNNLNYKTVSDYSTMTFESKPFVIPKYKAQIPNPSLVNNNLNNNNYFDLKSNHNIIIERRPRMINKSANQGRENRAFSTPSSQNARNFNQNQNIYQPNATNNPYQTNTFIRQNNLKTNIPYDRNTERIIANQKYNLNNQNNLNQQNLRNQFVNQSQQHQQGIRQVSSYTNKRMPALQQFKQQTSHEISQTKTQMFNQPINSQFKSQQSNPIPNNIPSLTQNNYDKQISQQQIALAQMASMQNQENPNFRDLAAITLKENIQTLDVPEERPYEQSNQLQLQQQQSQQQSQLQQAELQEEQKEEEQTDLNIEALFITEEGKVIFRNGLLRGIIHKYAEIDDVVSRIQDILLKGVKFHLVYKAFDLDDKAQTFHEKCDELDMSLVLIETDNDARFGGFTTKSWKGNCVKKKDNNAFVFNLETRKIFEIIENEPAIGGYPKFGPVFFGCQIRIYDNFFTKGGSTCHRGLNYNTNEDFELTNGEQKYLVKDIEVYRLETIDVS